MIRRGWAFSDLSRAGIAGAIGAGVVVSSGSTLTATYALSSLTSASFGSTPATGGVVNFSTAASTYTLIARKNNAGSGDLNFLRGIAGNDNFLLGDLASQLYIYGTQINFQMTNIIWENTVSAPKLSQGIHTTDSTPRTLTIQAQSASTSNSTGSNQNGGPLVLAGGSAKSDGSTGLRGSVRLSVGSASVIMLEVAEVVLGKRIVSLCKTTPVTSTEMPSGTGDQVIFIANGTAPTSSGAPAAATAPTYVTATTPPVGGGVLFVESGALKYCGTAGTITTLAVA